MKPLRTYWGGNQSASRAGCFTLGERARYPLNRRLDRPQNLCGRCGEKKNLSLSGIEPCRCSPQRFMTPVLTQWQSVRPCPDTLWALASWWYGGVPSTSTPTLCWYDGVVKWLQRTVPVWDYGTIPPLIISVQLLRKWNSIINTVCMPTV
jgi:hypothetical protein